CTVAARASSLSISHANGHPVRPLVGSADVTPTQTPPSSKFAAIALLLLAASVAAQENRAQEMLESMLARLDPDLIHAAEARGIYDRDALPVLRTMNPFFIRGDFNADGEMDVAFWVQNRETKEHGVAVLHSTLDELYLFGAGRPSS